MFLFCDLFMLKRWYYVAFCSALNWITWYALALVSKEVLHEWRSHIFHVFVFASLDFPMQFLLELWKKDLFVFLLDLPLFSNSNGLWRIENVSFFEFDSIWVHYFIFFMEKNFIMKKCLFKKIRRETFSSKLKRNISNWV